MSRHRRRPRVVQDDVTRTAREAVRQNIEEELALAVAYVEELKVLYRFVTQAEIQERSEGKPHPRPSDQSRMEDITS